MGLRGTKPLTEDMDERRWLHRVEAVAYRASVVAVYCTRDEPVVHVHDCSPGQREYAVRDGAVLVGRYKMPFSRADLLADIRLTLKALPK